MKWEFRPTMDVALATAQTCCGGQTRGLYYAEGKIFYATLDGQVIGLDAKSGEQLWRTVGTDISRGEGMAGNALVVHKNFIGGNEGGERGARGKVQAYNIDTGKQQWVMYNMGPNNEVGIGPRFKPIYPGDKIPNPALDSWYGQSWKTGGGTSWGFFTWDPEINIFYYSTGNCGPWNPDYRREWGKINLDANGVLQPPYKNNYCASQMARDPDTGELIWAYNISPTDMWDIDEPLITPLIDVDGKKLALKYARQGYLYVWDRATGELFNEPWAPTYVDIMKGVDMKQGAPKYDIDKILFTNVEDRRKYTQVDPRGGANKPANYTGTEVVHCPGNSARNWEQDAYSPRTKLLYTSTDTSCSTIVAVTGEYKPGEGYNLTRGAGGATNPPRLPDGKEAGNIAGQLQANDVISRKTVWHYDFLNDNNRNPILATASDLLFQGGNDQGVFRAFDAKDGKVLWSFRTGARYKQSPISYSFQGKQYIAIIASSAAANTAVAANARADDANRYRRSGSTLYVFKLPG